VIKVNIGDKLKSIRKSNKLTQHDVAELLGITQKNISAIESRDDIYLKTLKKYVRSLGAELKVYAEFKNKSLLLDLSENIKDE